MSISNVGKEIGLLNWDKLPKEVTSKILIHLFCDASDWGKWKNCCLTSREWKELSYQSHPLIIAIKTNQIEIVKDLLSRGAPVELRVNDSKHVFDKIDCTPYICAQEYKHEEIAALLKAKDKGFSGEYIKNKLATLCFQIATPFSLRGCTFEGEGLGHLGHHEHLIPHVIHSLKLFFAQYDHPHWNGEQTQQLISLLEMPHCLSCMNSEQLNEARSALKTGKRIFLSDSEIFKGVHWINVVAQNSLIAVANRGLGCGDFSGVRFHQMMQNFAFEHLHALVADEVKMKDAPLGRCLPELIVEGCARARLCFQCRMPKQIVGSCARTSLEAGVLAGVFFILRELCNPLRAKNEMQKASQNLRTKDEAQNIVEDWLKYDQILVLNQIMEEKGAGYDRTLFPYFLAAFDACLQTAEKFLQFLLSQGSVNWNELDSQGKSPVDYAKDRENSVFLTLAAKNGFFSLSNSYGKQLLSWSIEGKNYPVAELLLQLGVEINDNGCDRPFWDAIETGNTAVVRWLLEHGADANQGFKQGQQIVNPLDFVLEYYDFIYEGNNEIIELLKQYGAITSTTTEK